MAYIRKLFKKTFYEKMKKQLTFLQFFQILKKQFPKMDG